MIRMLVVVSALALLSIPALAQEQKYPKWMMDEAMPVEPRTPVTNPDALGTRPATRANKMSESNQFRRDEKPKPGALKPMYGSQHSLHLDQTARPSPNQPQPVKAPPRAR